ncbi:hypothetical protein E6W39_00310 [Kitasatospora acidiphila]|uniref:Uncharacterized protein n=1 Tax=Kitasatospora acidiphila TaxID=2567942 RepID=A0A540WG82_9ACTN|nr:DUF6309 family protein [Kitasatospora acidiphila]TQF08036.1 hypothetical protein E6W39_00310 [Kitasatospora acidiphila]
MRILAPVAFDRVRLAYLRDHPAERAHPGNSNRDGVENLWRAEQSLGCWHAVLLSRAEVLGVVLPWHTGEGGGYELVPRSGLTVAQTAAKLRARPTAIAAANPVCTAKLAFLADSPLTPVYLSTRAVPHCDYASVRPHGALVHVDGLHRMLAWELAGRLPEHERVEAFIAGDLGSLPRSPDEGGLRACSMTR